MPEARPATFVDRYRQGALGDLFRVAPGDADTALRRPDDIDRDGLADALEEGASRWGAHEAQHRSLTRLRHPEARVVVTGQQPGALLGPTYTLSKALGAIALARAWDTDGRPVIPVFWVASQDHDTAEIDDARVLDCDERLHALRAGWPEGVPAGAIPLGEDGLAALARGWRAMRLPAGTAEEAWALAEETYRAASSPADWFARLLTHLLGPDGLLVLDPLQPALAHQAAPVLSRELEAPRATVEAIDEAAARLRAIGETPGLGRGANATNLFLYEGHGRRRLLRFDGEAFHADGEPELRWTAGELQASLAREPTRITPAAGLRPVVQDALLPTAAVVVGPGELRYFAQLRGVYERHGIAMPLVWPRPEVTIVEPPVARILDRYGLGPDELAADPDGGLREVLLAREGHAERFERALDTIDREVGELMREVDGVDPTLRGAVARGRGYLDATVARLREKAGKALARRDDVTRRQFDRLRAHLLPDGRPQERVVSPFTYFAKFGVEVMMDRLRTVSAEGRHYLRVDPVRTAPSVQRRDSA